MDKVNKPRSQKFPTYPNPLEIVKDAGTGALKSLKTDFIDKVPGDFMDQIFGPKTQRNVSGEIAPGESLEFNELLSGRHEENLKIKKQLTLERMLHEEEKILQERKVGQLRIQLQAVMQEVTIISQKVQNLGEEVKVSAMQAPVEPGVYHLIFFEKLLEFIESFAKKIEQASVWLYAVNKRAQKKNYWASYKKHGGKFLLAPDHYLQRSAG